MFSEASNVLEKVFDRSFVTASFLPAMFFIFIQSLLIKYALPSDGFVVTQIKEFDTVGKVSLFVVITVILGVVLQLLNRPLIRLLEGYSLPSFMKREGERKRYRKWKEKERCGDDIAEWYIPKYFPDQESLLLRTRLGNAIRAYEYYPYKVYNIDPIPTWARLLTVVPKDYFSRIDASENGLDFFVNCTALFLLAGIEVLAAMLLSQNPYLAILSAICFIAMPFSYSNAVEQAVARGSVFKSCFDSYRIDLLKKMGFALPTSINEEREIWGKISLTFLFLIPPDLPYLTAKCPLTLSDTASDRPRTSDEGDESDDESD